MTFSTISTTKEVVSNPLSGEKIKGELSEVGNSKDATFQPDRFSPVKMNKNIKKVDRKECQEGPGQQKRTQKNISRVQKMASRHSRL